MALSRKNVGVLIILVLICILGAFAAQSLSADPTPVPDNAVILLAEQNDGHEPAWEKRHYYFKPTWGIRGSGVPESGSLWFNSFPGQTGLYEVRMDVIAERDGSPHFAVYAGERELQKGRFPYPGGKKDCEARGEVTSISLGRHLINQGEKIRVWGESVYECGEKGAYTLWYRLVFVPLGAFAS